MSEPVHHRGERPCFACEHHEYNWLGTRYDECNHPQAFTTKCLTERVTTSNNMTCGKDGRRFEIKTLPIKKWWEFWK